MEIFVFGSNTAGRHGKGAAKYAKEHYGAEVGVGAGRTGRAYALPTKDRYLNPLPLSYINKGIEDFLRYAKTHSEDTFIVTRVGCGLAGYKDAEVSIFFQSSPENCILPIEWQPYLPEVDLHRFHQRSDKSPALPPPESIQHSLL